MLAGLLKVGDGLDYQLDQSVLDVEARASSNVIEVVAYCGGDCRVSVQRAEEKAWLLEELTGRSVVFR